MNMLKIAYEIGRELALNSAGAPTTVPAAVLDKYAGWLSRLFGAGEAAAPKAGKSFKEWQAAKSFAAREAENAARAKRIEQARSVVRSTAGAASGGGGRALGYAHT